MLTDTFPALKTQPSRVAMVQDGTICTYDDLYTRINAITNELLRDEDDLYEKRIAILLPASFDYVSTLLAIWAAGGIAVPLNVHSTEQELEYSLKNSGAKLIFSASRYSTSLNNLSERLHVELLDVQQLSADQDRRELPRISPERRALMLFTSGTTSEPKGVVSTHANVQAQISALVQAWSWSNEDVIPIFLPVHHIHGIINVLCCALASGATVHLYPNFDAARILNDVKSGVFNLFMAVPTIYIKIVEYLSKLDSKESEAICSAFAAMRLNVSGSAACPVTLFEKWKYTTNQMLLERYGMTEIGMALSNPYKGERRAGFVGQPLPGVEVALFDEQDQKIAQENQPGEIRIRGKNVFLEYWENPEATAESFKADWFCTGDIGVVEGGYYRIMGRASVDIIKSGGYKLSALEIESVLLNHPAIKEVAVVGIDDPTWGELASAFIVLAAGEHLDYDELKIWCESHLSPYKIPKQVHLLDALPRNAMGKVTKPELKKTIQT